MPIEADVVFPPKQTMPVVEDGLYQAQILDISQIEKVPWGQPEDSPKEKYFSFKFGLLEGDIKEANGTFKKGGARGKWLNKDARIMAPVPSESGASKASTIWKIVSAALGHPLSYAEGVDFKPQDLNGLIGKQVILGVRKEEKPKKPGEFKNTIDSFHTVKAELPPLEDTAQAASDAEISLEDIPV